MGMFELKQKTEYERGISDWSSDVCSSDLEAGGVAAMNVDRLHQVIIAPVVSEKSTRVAEKANQAVFKVARDAEKPEIKEAVEKLFNVKVDEVRTLLVKGKSKRFGRFSGKRSDWKKAYVTLAKDRKSDFISGGGADAATPTSLVQLHTTSARTHKPVKRAP